LRIDLHQHLWLASLIDALRARRQPPWLEERRLGLFGGERWDIDPAERELGLGSADRHRVYRAGECFSFDPSRIYRLVCERACAISVHAYSAPLWRIEQYIADETGALHQLSVAYADELRPLEFATA
jgi:hypothetical protein